MTEQDQRVAWPFPTPLRMWREAVGLGGSPREQFLIGAALMIKWEAWADVGGFDERFFLYAEETDWQLRASLRGWSVALIPEVTAFHRGAGTSSDVQRREILFHAGTETYIRKWYGNVGWAIYRSAAILAAGLRVLLAGGRRSVAWRRLQIYMRGPRRAAGLHPT